MKEYTEEALEIIENTIMTMIDDTLTVIENKEDLLEMLIDTLQSRMQELS